ncbi:FAD/NAD(P)-binding protein [Rhizobium rhizogenes]|uniref:FAD/NAD(P)-binding protein n=1 Tax=Rhizobium rhizogenes TaxID=359 RepID=UPI000645FF5F|nr:FAD/NAD(P)-binding protein [Rhizobium rhizogenes]
MTTDSHDPSNDRPVIAIIGGGVSGAAVAFHLLQRQRLQPGQLFIFEPRARLGAGLAYDTQDPAHRINVPAAKMSLLPDDLEHFQRWIEANDALVGDETAVAANGNLFPRRALFGRYIGDMVQPFVDDGRITHVAEKTAEVRRLNDRWVISGEAGRRLEADILVIATSHPSPLPPEPLRRALAGHPRFVVDPTRPDAVAAIRADDRVLVVGNGLTSADVIASLTLRGHTGPITAISRRGLRSRGHAPVRQELFGDFVSHPSRTALDLLRLVRATIREAEAEGRSWHAVIDQVRAQGQDLWRAMPLEERRRVVRHLRPFWDVHRFRVAPQVEAASEEAIRNGRLEVLAASVASVETKDEAIDCRLRLSHSAGNIDRQFDAVVVTTGPGHRGILETQGWIGALADAGYLAIDATRLGLACNAASQALSDDGAVAPSLFISGPLARGTFGELMGLPEVVEHGVFVAGQVASAICDHANRKHDRPLFDTSAA